MSEPGDTNKGPVLKKKILCAFNNFFKNSVKLAQNRHAGLVFLRRTAFTCSVIVRRVDVWHWGKTNQLIFLSAVCFVGAISSGLPDETKAINGTVVVATGLQQDASRPVWARPEDILMICFRFVPQEDVFSEENPDVHSLTETSP